MINLRPVSTLALLCVSLLAMPAYAACPDAVAVSAQAPSAVNTYEVLRKGKPIGTHTISFFPNGQSMRVLAETKMRVNVLFINAFKYDYASDERYCNGVLQSVVTEIDNNGEDVAVNITKEDAGYRSESEKYGVNLAAQPFYTSNHWNMDGLKTTQIMNTATGKLEGVAINPSTSLPNGQEYAVRGDIDYDTKYSPEGHWLGMVFDHPKGGAIEFRCLDCRNTPLNASAVAQGIQSGP